ncbi:MAG: hypothetical protein CMP22_03735 [Rickettsiales bacterium]|nr:hypothetical protein [Rickettsiales bacterium]
MKEILRSNDIIRLTWAKNLLEEHDIQAFHLDYNMAMAEGSISAIQQRLMVIEEDYEQAKSLLDKAIEELG